MAVKMNLDEWDRKVKPYLATINIRAGWIINDARQIQTWIENLPCIPDFETEARDRLNKLRNELIAAIEIVGNAIKAYDGKPQIK